MPPPEGCPGAGAFDFRGRKRSKTEEAAGAVASRLRQWPIQLHLVQPTAPYYQGADVLLAADCTAYAVGDFHLRFLEGKVLAIVCPKLDGAQERYLDKIKAWFDEAGIRSLTILIMQVPCCMGLVELVRRARMEASRRVPTKCVVVGPTGEVLREEQVD